MSARITYPELADMAVRAPCFLGWGLLGRDAAQAILGLVVSIGFHDDWTLPHRLRAKT